MKYKGVSKLAIALIIVVIILVATLGYTTYLLLTRPGPPPGNITTTVTQSPVIATVSGVVKDSETGAPISGATVTLDGYKATTGPDGSFSLTVPGGTYTLTVSISGYQTYTTSLEITEAKTYTLTISLAATPLPVPKFVQENKIVIESGSTYQWLDPHVSYYQFDYWILSHSVETLVWYYKGNASRIIPWLAESWTMINETTYEFKLREGITFQNDRPFNATAVWFSLNRLLIIDGTSGSGVHGSQAAWMIEQLLDPYGEIFAGMGASPSYDADWVKTVLSLNFVEIIDPYTVRLHLRRPTSQLIPILAGVWAAIIEPYETIKRDYEYHEWPFEAEQTPRINFTKYFIRMAGVGDTYFNVPTDGWKIGTGPYYIESVDPSTYRVVLKAYDGYWGGPDRINLPPEGKKRIETIEFLYQPSFTTRLLDLKEGTATGIQVSPADLFSIVDRDTWIKEGVFKSLIPGVTVYGPIPTLTTYWLNFCTNVTNPDGTFREWQPFADRRIRLAVASSVNLTYANIYLNNRLGIIAYNIIPPGTYPPGSYNPNIKPAYSFNLTLAEKLLLDAYEHPMTSATHEMYYYNGTRIPPGVVDNTFGPDRPRVIEFYVGSGATTFIQVLSTMADNLNAISRKHNLGLTFRVVIVPWGQQYTLASLHQIDAYMGGWVADYNHVMDWLQPMYYYSGAYPSWNLWNISKLNELYEEAVKADMAGDLDRLVEISNEMNSIANHLVMYMVFWHPLEYYVRSSWLKGLYINPALGYDIWATAYYETP